MTDLGEKKTAPECLTITRQCRILKALFWKAERNT